MLLTNPKHFRSILQLAIRDCYPDETAERGIFFDNKSRFTISKRALSREYNKEVGDVRVSFLIYKRSSASYFLHGVLENLRTSESYQVRANLLGYPKISSNKALQDTRIEKLMYNSDTIIQK